MKKYLLLFMILFCAFCLNTDAATLVKTDSGYKYTRHDARKGEDALMSETLSFYQMDGKVSYCIDPGIHEGTNNYVEGSMADLGLSSDVQERVMLTAYYGYTMPSHGTTKYRVATQALIWEAVMGNDSYVNFSTDYWNNGTELNVDREKSRINSLINYHYVLPSFINDSYEINIGESIVLKDDNGVDFDDLLILPIKLFKEHKEILEKFYTDGHDKDDFHYIVCGSILQLMAR